MEIKGIIDTGILPPLYSEWISNVISGPLPTEKNSTCNDCAMCQKQGESADKAAAYFNPKIKCCTYVPEMYNFLVGRILLEEHESNVPGREALINRIGKGISVHPIGVGRDRVYSLLYKYQTNSAFGRAEKMRCPYYVEEGGLCGVWKHRNSVCSTWFCKHDRGATGEYFWKNVQRLLGFIEESLSRWCLLQLDLSTEALQEIFAMPGHQGPVDTNDLLDTNQLDEKLDRKLYDLRWGSWKGRETDFYVKCAKLVNELSWDEVLNICGPEAKLFTKLVQDAYGKMINNEVPENLKPGAIKLSLIKDDSILVETYSNYNPLLLDRILLEVLPYFDGRCLKEVQQTVSIEMNIDLDANYIRTLVDHGILIPA